MMCPRGIIQEGAPLLDWPERHEVERLEAKRRDLMDRINALPRNAHRRVELEARLRTLTVQQLQLAQVLDRGDCA